MGRVKYCVKAAHVIINFVLNSAGTPRTLDSSRSPHYDALCHTLYFESLEWNEAKKTAVVDESCHPTGDP